MNVGRAFLAVALQVLLAAVVTTNIVPIFASILASPSPSGLGGGTPQAIRTTMVPTSSIVIGIIAAFIAGWWGSSGVGERWIQRGALIGGLVALAWTMIAIAGATLEPRTALVLAYVPAALAGALVASRDMHTRRAFVAAGFQVVATLIVWLILLLVLAWIVRGRQLSDADVALFYANALWVSVVLRTSTAFLAGWWAGQGSAADAIKYGRLIGVLIIAFSGIVTIVLRGTLDWPDVLFGLPVIPGAIAGIVFARSRSRARVP